MTNTTTIDIIRDYSRGYSSSNILVRSWAKSIPLGENLINNFSTNSTTATPLQFRHPTKSSAISLLRHARGWASDDMLDILEQVVDSREPARF